MVERGKGFNGMINVMKYFFPLAIIFTLFFFSCNEDPSIYEGTKQSGEEVELISVELATRDGSEDDLEDDSEFEEKNSYDGGILNDEFVNNVSLLFVSQLGTTLTPNFVNDGADNLYTYVYNENTNASWSSGFNFAPAPKENTTALTWNTIRSNGASLAGYTLFGIYMPYNNTLPSNQNVFQVKADQRNLDDLKQSNVLGAFHATSSLFTPLRFRLFHLTVFLEINVYIPVYKFEEGEGYTGFMKDGMQSAEVMGVNPNFTIKWNAVRPSDIYPPMVDFSGNESINIPLYQIKDQNGNPLIEEETIEIPENYVGNIGNSTITEEVYVYHFCVLIPPQTDSFTNSSFLKFKFKTPGGSVKTYTFNGSDQTAPGGNLGMTQGTKQQINLYLSRYGTDVLLMKAKVMPWTPAYTEMNITNESKN